MHFLVIHFASYFWLCMSLLLMCLVSFLTFFLWAFYFPFLHLVSLFKYWSSEEDKWQDIWLSAYEGPPFIWDVNADITSNFLKFNLFGAFISQYQQQNVSMPFRRGPVNCLTVHILGYSDKRVFFCLTIKKLRSSLKVLSH